MRTYLHLAATLLLTGAATTHAQVFNPDNLIGKPPAPPTHYQGAPSDNLQWLWQYTQPTPRGSKPTLLADNRFPTLLKDQLKAPQAMWGIGVPLSDAAAAFLAGDGTIASTDNRHLTITGCVPDHCPQRGPPLARSRPHQPAARLRSPPLERARPRHRRARRHLHPLALPQPRPRPPPAPRRPQVLAPSPGSAPRPAPTTPSPTSSSSAPPAPPT